MAKIEVVKTFDLTDYEKSHRRDGVDSPEIGLRRLASEEIEHVDGKWEAFIDLGGLREMSERADTSEKAVRNLVSRLKSDAGYLMKKANYLLNKKIPATLEDEVTGAG